MGIQKQFDVRIGTLPTGERNQITDVKGIRVGHVTLNEGEVQTGVTAILPHGGNMFRDKLVAGCAVLNGFGKTTGLVQLQELGVIETPILLTNTFAVGEVYSAVVEYMLSSNPDIGVTTCTVNPIVCECNDGDLNDIRHINVKREHVFEALRNASEDFAEGAVGGGRGMICHDLKGGIGSASRIVKAGDHSYTVGCLVMANHGLLADLTINGRNVGKEIADRIASKKDQGSIIMILATDAPMTNRQLNRISRRAAVGLARAGSFIGHGSGDIAIAFSTAQTIPHYQGPDPLALSAVHEEYIEDFFRGAAEAVEESVLSALYHGETITGVRNNTVYSLRERLAELQTKS